MHIGIVGCGQLAQMMALAGLQSGIRFSFIAEQGEDTVCVKGLGDIIVNEPNLSAEELYHNLGKPDCITVEREQVLLGLLESLSAYCSIYPGLKAIAASQHRYKEKQLLDSLNIPFAPYVYNQSIKKALENLDLPLIVKSCSDGYDGKNQWHINTQEEAVAFDDTVNVNDYIIEQKICFEKEVSQIAVRAKDGKILFYPLTENIHKKGILVQSMAPAQEADRIESKAQEYIASIMNTLDYVGVMAMECFVIKGELLVNELAPRVHNSGHWTQQGSLTSQFENHIRAIAGIAIGNTESVSVAGMLNLIGCEKPALNVIGQNSTLHWYNKSVRPGRKLGHINFTEKSYDRLSCVVNETEKDLGFI